MSFKIPFIINPKNYKKYIIHIIMFFVLILIIFISFNYFFVKEKVILVISNNSIKNLSEITPYLLDNVVPVIYDYDTINNFQDIIDIINNLIKKNNIKKISRVGFMFNVVKEDTLSLFKNDITREVNTNHDHLYDNIEDYYDFILFCNYINNLTGAKNIDLISGRIIPERNKNIFSFINSEDLTINLSSGDTGGVEGDWYLDQGNVNLVGLYFNKNIENSGISLK
jgi:hypothetical protein